MFPHRKDKEEELHDPEIEKMKDKQKQIELRLKRIEKMLGIVRVDDSRKLRAS